jgi:hypothetical protein
MFITVKSTKMKKTNFLNFKLISGATGLHLAIAYGNDELAQCIVECGTPVDIRAMGKYIFHNKLS